MIEFPLNLRDNDEQEAWRMGSVWLSLDRFERFWPDVGLALANGESVKSAVRDTLRVKFAYDAEWRAAYFADPDAPEDFEAPDPTKDLPQICFRRINETAGLHDAECIARWLAGPVLGAEKEWTDHPWHMWHKAWNSLVYQLGEEDPKLFAYRNGLSLNIARRLIDIAARFKSEVDVNRERIKAADQEPLSGWDAIAYADYRWECPEPSPLDGLSLHLKYIGFERAWPEIMRCTPPTDIDALIKWGRANVGPKDPSYERVTIPDDIRAAWHQAWRN